MLFRSITENSYFFPFDDQVFDYSDPQENINQALSFNVYEDFDNPLSGVVLSDAYYFEINQPTPEINVAAVDSISILTAILFALIGGLILNLMPCVLPVIALKGLSLVKSASESKTSVTVSAGAYVVGVIITFMIIAFTLVTLKNAGEIGRAHV